MDDVVVIMEILKYFNFEELCIAERINANFKSCVQSELRRLRYIDLDRIFTYSWMDVINKIQAHCSGLRHLKNFNSVTSFMVKKRWWDLPDPSIEEDFEDNFFIPLPGLEKLACLEFDLKFIEVFGWKYTLNLVENARRLEQLSAVIHANKIFNPEVERIYKFIIGHSALRKLEIIQHIILMIDFTSCRNLTHFSLTLYDRMLSADYEQLYALLDANLNLATVEIATVSPNKLPLMEKLMSLPKLKSLLLHISGEDSNLPYHRIIKDLYFASLQNIRVICEHENFESHAKFVAFLLTRSPQLKEFSFFAHTTDLAFYRILFDKFPLYNQIEIFKLDHREPSDEVKSFIYNEVSKMVNLKYFRLFFNHFDSNYIRKISKLRKLKFLHWSSKDAAALKKMSCNSSLQGIDLDNNSASPASLDLILDQCPNLHYFRVDRLNGQEIRKLPLKVPKLEYFQLCYHISKTIPVTVDDLTYLVENLPNLRQLCIPDKLYELLLEHQPMKRLSRQKRLLIITDWHGSFPKHLINDRFINECIQLTCQQTPSTGNIARSRKYNVDPRSISNVSTGKDLVINNPLSCADDSPWRQYFLDVQSLAYIKQDVDRIFPELTFFQCPKIRQMMLDILFVFSREFEHLSYKQGMHEILGPLIFVLYADTESLAQALESKEFNCCKGQSCKNKILIQQAIDAKYIEHDAYTMFASIMEIIKDYYCYCKDRVPQYRRRKISLVDTIFLSEAERAKLLWSKDRQDSPSTLVFKLDYLSTEFLEGVDPVLFQHLEKMDIPPQVYGIRWLRLLFGREFPMQDLLFIWDAIFCFGPPFCLVDCMFIAMLCYIRDSLLAADYSGCLNYLMHYPPVSDVNELLSFALHLLDPNKYERPKRLSPSKFVYVPPGTKPKDRHKHQYIYYPTTPIIQSLDRSLNLRSSTRFFRIPTEEPPSSKKCKFFKNSPKKTANIGNNNASSENPFDSRGSPPDAQAQKAKKAFVKKALSEKGSPSVADPSKIITEEELELLKEQVNCLQSRLSEVEFNARQAATKMMKLFTIMDDRLKVVSVMDDEELFNLIRQVRNLCQNLNGNSSSSQKSNVENGTKANTKNKIKTPENKTPPPPTNQKKNELSIDEPVEIAKEAGNTPPKPDDQSETTAANENEQNDSPYGPIIISEKSRNLGPKNEMTELFFFKNRR